MQKIKIYLSQSDFLDLAKVTDFNCVSIYYSLTNELETSKKILKNTISELQTGLQSKNINATVSKEIINKLNELYTNPLLWNPKVLKEAKAIAIFLNENKLDSFLLNKPVEKTIFITQNYYLLPLFDIVNNQKIITNTQKLHDLKEGNEKLISEIKKIIPLAYENKIARLYVSSKNGVYGLYDSVNKNTIIDKEKRNDNMSLVNLAAIATHLHGGDVHLVDPKYMPIQTNSVQAILKY